MESASPQEVPFALKLMVPLLETSPDKVRSPVPRFLQLAPEAIVATVPVPLVVKLDDDAPEPWSNTPLVTLSALAVVAIAPRLPSSATTFVGDVPELLT